MPEVPIGNHLRDILFAGDILIAGVVLCLILLFVMSFMLRQMRKKEEPEK